MCSHSVLAFQWSGERWSCSAQKGITLRFWVIDCFRTESLNWEEWRSFETRDSVRSWKVPRWDWQDWRTNLLQISIMALFITIQNFWLFFFTDKHFHFNTFTTMFQHWLTVVCFSRYTQKKFLEFYHQCIPAFYSILHLVLHVIYTVFARTMFNTILMLFQILESSVMQRLKIENTLNLPMHVHCSQLELPVQPSKGKLSKTKKLTIKAPLPDFFKESLRELKLDFKRTNNGGTNTDPSTEQS